MPTEIEHIAAATRNQELLNFLLPEVDKFADWVAVVAFYKALHVVEAMLFLNHPDKHSFSHEHREDVLKRTKRYEFIYRNYRPLWDASLNARYLAIGNRSPSKFSDRYSPAIVTTRLIGHNLRQVENGVERILGNWPAGLPKCG